MTKNLAEILARDPLYPTTPCQYCSGPVGYGEHEKYCSKNPENLARLCGYGGCINSGNVIYGEGDWICRGHADLRSAHARLKSAKSNISFAKSTMKSLQTELAKIRLSIPQMMEKEIEAKEHLEKTKFKSVLAGVETN